MKQLLPFFLFIFIAFQSLAQDVTVSPNPYVENFSVDISNDFSEAVAHTTMKNNSNDSVYVRWDVMPAMDCPDEWASLVCDKNQCYTDFITSNQGGPVNKAVALAGGEEATFDFHLKPKGVKACCMPTIKISNYDDNSIEYETVTFEVCIDDITSDVSEREKANLKVYPNPTPDYISVSNSSFVKELWVSNILGKRVRAFDTSASNNYDISNLPDGIYLVSMVGEDRRVLKTVRISKRAIRP